MDIVKNKKLKDGIFVRFTRISTKILDPYIILVSGKLDAYSIVCSWLYFFIFHPLTWKIADKFVEFTKPTLIKTDGLIDTFFIKLKLLVGPQVISVSVVLFLVVMHGDLDSIAKIIFNVKQQDIQSLPLPVEKSTGYTVYDANRNNNKIPAETVFVTKPLNSMKEENFIDNPISHIQLEDKIQTTENVDTNNESLSTSDSTSSDINSPEENSN